MNGFALSQTVGVLVIGVTGGLQERAAPDSYSPATLGPSVMIGSGPVDVLRPPAISGEEICNSLDITDTQAYNYGNGNCWGGESIFGITYDLQCAQSCEFFADCCVSDCTVDSLTFGSHNASDALYLGVFEDGDGDCIPDNAATGEAVVPTTAFANFSDTIFGLIGTRATGSGDGFDICAPAGNNFVLIQPVTSPSAGGSSGDWCYVVRDDAIRGCDSVLRDGPNNSGGGGYGTSTWITAGSFCCPGANAQAVSVKCGPPVPKCLYQINRVHLGLSRTIRDVCGKTTTYPACTDCPYAVGDIICTFDCDEDTVCFPELNGTTACPDGGQCQGWAALVGCGVCPDDSTGCDDQVDYVCLGAKDCRDACRDGVYTKVKVDADLQLYDATEHSGPGKVSNLGDFIKKVNKKFDDLGGRRRISVWYDGHGCIGSVIVGLGKDEEDKSKSTENNNATKIDSSNAIWFSQQIYQKVNRITFFSCGGGESQNFLDLFGRWGIEAQGYDQCVEVGIGRFFKDAPVYHLIPTGANLKKADTRPKCVYDTVYPESCRRCQKKRELQVFFSDKPCETANDCIPVPNPRKCRCVEERDCDIAYESPQCVLPAARKKANPPNGLHCPKE